MAAIFDCFNFSTFYLSLIDECVQKSGSTDQIELDVITICDNDDLPFTSRIWWDLCDVFNAAQHASLLQFFNLKTKCTIYWRNLRLRYAYVPNGHELSRGYYGLRETKCVCSIWWQSWIGLQSATTTTSFSTSRIWWDSCDVFNFSAFYLSLTDKCVQKSGSTDLKFKHKVR